MHARVVADHAGRQQWPAQAIDELLVALFIEAHRRAPEEIVIDLDTTDLALHGGQEGRFFHGYYDSYCYLPLYIFCGEHLLLARLRTADQDASAGCVQEIERMVKQIRAAWPKARIVSLTRYTQPEPELKLLLDKLKLTLPAQAPPKISAEQSARAATV